MNIFLFSVHDATTTLVVALFAGIMIGTIIWILRYMIVDLPNVGIKWKGGEKYT